MPSQSFMSYYSSHNFSVSCGPLTILMWPCEHLPHLKQSLFHLHSYNSAKVGLSGAVLLQAGPQAQHAPFPLLLQGMKDAFKKTQTH